MYCKQLFNITCAPTLHLSGFYEYLNKWMKERKQDSSSLPFKLKKSQISFILTGHSWYQEVTSSPVTVFIYFGPWHHNTSLCIGPGPCETLRRCMEAAGTVLRIWSHDTHTTYHTWISSVQFSRSFMSDSLRPHELQYARPPCPSLTPRVYSNSCPLSRWCHLAISSSVIPFSSCPQSLPASGSFPMSQLFVWGGQSIGVSASASVLPMSTQDWSPLGWTGWISLQSKGLSRVLSNPTVQKHQFFSAQLSSQSNSQIHTWPLEKP